MQFSMSLARVLTFSLIILLAVISITLQQAESIVSQLQLSGYTMGTTYNIKYLPGAQTPPASVLRHDIDALLVAINQTMSTYDKDSELSRFNRQLTTQWVPVSASLFTVVSAATVIGVQSESAFDITVAPLVNLWGFGPEFRADHIPDEAAILAVRRHVGYDKFVLRDTPPALRKLDPAVILDLSGIAKGYGVDRVAEYLQAQGVDRYMVEIGGEIRVSGLNEKDRPWRIAIEKPLPGERSVQKILALSDISLATSGDYRNFYEIAGRRYAHIIDPATGWPVDNDLISVTVLADSCMQADAWSTALQVLGLERGMALADRHGLAALFIIEHNGGFAEFANKAFQPYH